MDIEHLQLILDMVGQVSGDALTFAVTFIVLDKVLPFILFMTFFCVVYRVAKLIYKACKSDNKEYFWTDMRDLLGTGSPGTLTKDEVRRTEAAIRRLVSASIADSNALVEEGEG